MPFCFKELAVEFEPIRNGEIFRRNWKMSNIWYSVALVIVGFCLCFGLVTLFYFIIIIIFFFFHFNNWNDKPFHGFLPNFDNNLLKKKKQTNKTKQNKKKNKWLHDDGLKLSPYKIMSILHPCEAILCFHSRGQHLCKFIGTKESVYISKDSTPTGLGLGHKYGPITSCENTQYLRSLKTCHFQTWQVYVF